MALKDKPYLPLYTKDFTTDENLIECSAESVGVYIFLMCALHKQEEYGTVLLKQKYKQSDNQIQNFCSQIKKYFPWEMAIIFAGISELLDNNVLEIKGDFLIQKRMVRDNSLSETRSDVGKKGGKKTAKNNKNFAKEFAVPKAKAKKVANTDIDNDNESDIVNENKTEGVQGEIVLPYESEQFKKTWYVLIASKKWRKKENNALQAALVKLSKYPEAEAIEMMTNAIIGNWQGLFETETRKKLGNGQITKSGTGQGKPHGLREMRDVSSEILKRFTGTDNAQAGA